MKRGKRLLAALLGGLLIGLLPLGALAEEAPAVIVDIEGGETAEALMAEGPSLPTRRLWMSGASPLF